MNQIETARILIRPYRPSDADSVWQVLRRKEIYDTTYAIPRNYPRERVDWWIQFVESARKNRTSYEFGMFDKHTGAYLGNCGVINVPPCAPALFLTLSIRTAGTWATPQRPVPPCWPLLSTSWAFAGSQAGVWRKTALPGRLWKSWAFFTRAPAGVSC